MPALDYEREIAALLSDPERLMTKKPYTRGCEPIPDCGASVPPGGRVPAIIPDFSRNEVSQSMFLKELDPDSHDVLFDDNLPCITVKTKNGAFMDLKFKRTSLPIQKMILSKHVLHLCGNKTLITLEEPNPDEQTARDVSFIKSMWASRNMDGYRTRFVEDQMSCGDSGLLFYFDRNGRIKSRVISYKDGYVICAHNDNNGDRLLDSICYKSNGDVCIDSYSDKYIYRHRLGSDGKWTLLEPIEHGFSESPLVTKRGNVPWNGVENLIETLETIYNVFVVVQKRHGWGILYIKGELNNEGKKIAGNVVLQDNSPMRDGDAKYLQAPSPEGMMDTMKDLFEKIQMGSGTTFILPKDISLGGDISGVAVQIAQSMDNESSLSAAIDWQNAISKMMRLFKEGLSIELVNRGEDPTAITRYRGIELSAKMKPWTPRSDYEYNQMLVQLNGSGLLSKKTAVEKNTESLPDELLRIDAEAVSVENTAEETGLNIETQN